MPHGRLDSSATITPVNAMASMTTDLVLEDSSPASGSMDLKRGNSSADSGVDIGKSANEKFESDMDSILEVKKKKGYFGKLQKNRSWVVNSSVSKMDDDVGSAEIVG